MNKVGGLDLKKNKIKWCVKTVIQNEMSEREIQISYINTYMWNLEKCYRWSKCKAEIDTQV